VRSWFTEAFARVGGRMVERETGRFEITRVPDTVRHRDRAIGAGTPVLPRYERVVFDKALIRCEGRPLAELLAPGHALLESVLDLTLEAHAPLLRRGAILIDETGQTSAPVVLVLLEHAITDAHDVPGGRRVVSRRFEFVELSADGTVRTAGYAPYLDHRPASESELAVAARLLTDRWPVAGVEDDAVRHAITTAVPAHLAEVRARTVARVAKVRAAVRERLTKEIAYWDRRAAELREQAEAGRQPRMNPDRAQARADELAGRLKARVADLEQDEKLSALPPVVVGAALIVPLAWLEYPEGNTSSAAPELARETHGVERRAVDAVIAAEKSLGRIPTEMTHNNPGYDVQSEADDGSLLFIEVKGRLTGADTFIVTRNEILHGLNVPDAWVLALVDVSPDGPEHDEVRYLRRPFGETVHLPFATTATSLAWREYWEKGTTPS
jgi:hypothetical protein